jgi:hypothetical protein
MIIRIIAESFTCMKTVGDPVVVSLDDSTNPLYV